MDPTKPLAIAGVLFVAFIYLLMSDQAHGQQCLDYKEVRSQLGSDYQEEPFAIGLTNEGGVMALFSTEDGMTWTIIYTEPDGCSEVIQAGEALIKVSKPVGRGS